MKRFRIRNKRTAVYVAGDSNIFFPALVAMISIEESNPRVFDRFFCCDRTTLTEAQVERLTSNGVQLIDSAEVIDSDRLDALGTMFENRWPAAVYLNWAVPEYLYRMGYENSLKIDYDVLCLGRLDDEIRGRGDKFFCSALLTKISTEIPADALAEISKQTGLLEPRKFSINSGVVAFNNAYCDKISFFDTLSQVVAIMNEMCPTLRTIEQAAIALIASNHADGFVPLPRPYNQRALARTFPAGFNPDVRITHFATRYKPWLEISDADLVALAAMGYGMVPIYRNLWLEYARRIEGFERYTAQRPLTALQLVGAVSTVITQERERASTAPATTDTSKSVKDALLHQRRKLSNQIGERLDWTVGYGPFAGMKMSRETWWSRPSRASMFLGLYEQEVLESLFDVDAKYRVFVDVGAADGYYAVGSLISGRFDRCYCFEMDERGRKLIQANAEANGVADRVTIFGEANESSWQLVPEHDLAAAVVMVDTEGAEFDMLTSSAFRKLANSVVIVETHPFKVKDGDVRMSQLRERAEATHTITEMTTTARDLSVFPEVADLGDTDRWLICSEGRRELMTWLRFDPR